MAAKVCQLLNGGIRYGKDGLKTAAASYEPGLLVKIDTSGSTVTTSGSAAANKPFGFLWGNRLRVYTPLSRVYDSGEEVTVVTGQGLVALSADFFAGGSLPVTGDKLYNAQAGLWSTNAAGSNVIGDVIEIKARVEPVSGVGASQNLAICRFNFTP